MYKYEETPQGTLSPWEFSFSPHDIDAYDMESDDEEMDLRVIRFGLRYIEHILGNTAISQTKLIPKKTYLGES